MSALPPKADMCSALADVRYVPIADIGRLFDHFVGASEQRWWYCKAERLGGLEVDDQLELSRPQDRHVGWLLALENATGIDAEPGGPGRCCWVRSSSARPLRHPRGKGRSRAPRGAPLAWRVEHGC